MTSTFLPLMIGFVIMSLGSLLIYMHGSKHPEIRHHTHFHAVVPFIAATSYLAMTLGLGVTAVDGETLYLPRYVDWTFTTPILLVGLTLTGLHEHHRHSSYILPIVVLDVLMIVTGLFSALADNAGERWIWYAWSCVAFAGVLYLLWVPVRAISDEMGGQMETVYRKNLLFLTLVWFFYPVVFLLGPQGVGVIDNVADVWIILVLDVVAKVGYGFLAASRFKTVPRNEFPKMA
jgi:bacteriorhodopsin